VEKALVLKKLEQINSLVMELKELFNEPQEESQEVTRNTVTLLNEDGDEEVIDLDKMSLKELKQLAKDIEVELKSKKKESIIVELVEAINADHEEAENEEPEDAFEEEENEESEEESEEDEDIAEAYGLNDLSNDELVEILESAGLSVKGKRQALIDRIVEAVVNGDIELATEDEEEENGEDEEKDNDEEDSENDPIAKREKEVAAKVRKDIESGKLKLSAIKEFMTNYYEGDPDCADCPKKCGKDTLVDCYVEIMKAMVDDEGEVNEFETPYVRDGENYCCGKPLEELDNGNLLCTVCGSEYED